MIFTYICKADKYNSLISEFSMSSGIKMLANFNAEIKATLGQEKSWQTKKTRRGFITAHLRKKFKKQRIQHLQYFMHFTDIPVPNFTVNTLITPWILHPKHAQHPWNSMLNNFPNIRKTLLKILPRRVTERGSIIRTSVRSRSKYTSVQTT